MSELGTPEPAVAVDQPLDIQHDPYPADDHGTAKRIPHLGHLALLLSILAISGLFSAALFALLTKGHPGARESPVAQMAVEATIYLITLAISFKVFPLLWKRSFLSGIEFNSLAVQRNFPRLLVAGVLLCILAQLPDRFISEPKHPEIEHLMSTQSGAWSALLLGVLLAPLCEEIVFRGFLLPALATAYDWLSLDRTPAGIERWQRSTAHTTPAKVFAALLSSLAFALLHAPQDRYAWGIIAVLFFVGLVLAFVRLKLHSVAASTLVHMTYNGTLFAVMVVVTRGFRHLDRLQS
jgi:uncharacterized protein